MAASPKQQVVLLVQLAHDYLAGTMSAAVFDDRFRHEFAVLPLGVPATTFSILEELAFACEDYVEDATIREPGDLDEAGLWRATSDLMRRLGSASD